MSNDVELAALQTEVAALQAGLDVAKSELARIEAENVGLRSLVSQYEIVIDSWELPG